MKTRLHIAHLPIAAALVLAIAAPASASAQVVDPVSVRESVAVPAGAARSLTLSCPDTAVALSGAATSALVARDSLPGTDSRRWRFRFVAGQSPARGAAVLRCVRLRLPAGVRGGRLVVGTVREPGVRVPAGATRRLALRCRGGQIPTGWGLERGAAALAIAAAVPTRRGWQFAIENTGRAAATGTLRIRCLVPTQRAQTGQRHTFETRVATSGDEVVRSGGRTTHSCRRSEFSLTAGLSLDPATDLLLTGAYPQGERGARWTFRGSGVVDTSLVCLALGTSFR